MDTSLGVHLILINFSAYFYKVNLNYRLECDAILHLLQAQILMSDWKFLASLMQLYEAHTKLTTWGATAQLKEVFILVKT